MADIDVANVLRSVQNHLRRHGFAPRDADPTDFARRNDGRLRFKTGTSYGEVTVVPWFDKQRGRDREVIRIIMPHQVAGALMKVDNLISAFPLVPEVEPQTQKPIGEAERSTEQRQQDKPVRESHSGWTTSEGA